MVRRKSKRRRLVAPAPVTLGPDLSGPKTSGSSSASVHPNTETEPLHFDDVELEGIPSPWSSAFSPSSSPSIDTGLHYQHGTDPNALEVPVSAPCTESTGSSSTSALVDTDFILDLAKNNKIIWVQGSGDNEDPEDFQKRMNGRLAEILSTNLPHTVETLRNLHPCDFCTKTLGKSSNSRSKNAATRTYRFCVDCDMYLCKLCSKNFKKHAEASRLRTKIALETASKGKKVRPNKTSAAV